MLAPDVARGLTLLGIAGANVSTAWVQGTDAPMAGMVGGVYDSSVWDKLAVVFGCVFFHVRGLPMFSTMLGFGIGLIAGSLYRRGFPLGKARRVIVRRYGFLALFGLIHCIFLFYGDIMLFYGLAGMLMATMIALKDKTLLILAGLGAVLNALMYIPLAVLGMLGSSFLASDTGTAGAMGTTTNNLTGPILTYTDQLAEGGLLAAMSPFLFLAQAPMLMPLMLVGFVAARRGILTNPGAHMKVLRWTMWAGIAVMVALGLPTGLAFIGILPESFGPPLFLLNMVFGVVTGPAIIAMITLALRPVQRRLSGAGTAEPGQLPVWLRMIVGLGKRSMTGYLLQSILFTILVCPWTLGLSQGKGAADSFVVAVGVWLSSLVICGLLELLGKPGPFEWVHRRLSYGKRGLPTAYHPAGASNSTAASTVQQPGAE